MRRPSPWLRAALAAAISGTLPDWMAPPSRERALAIEMKTVSSCLVIPLTVATRLGMRSARRCSWAWIWPLAWFTLSSSVWIVL